MNVNCKRLSLRYQYVVLFYVFATLCLTTGGDTMTAVAAPLFLGINIPWHWFGYDIGGGAFDEGWFDGFFASVSGKANVARFFLHCDGRATIYRGYRALGYLYRYMILHRQRNAL